MKKYGLSALCAVLLAACGGNTDYPSADAAQAPVRLAAQAAAADNTDTAKNRFAADIAKALPAFPGAEIGAQTYREFTIGGAGTLLVFRMDPGSLRESEQKARAHALSAAVPGTHAAVLRPHPDAPPTLVPTWGVVRDVAAHCSNSKANGLVACSMPDTTDEAMPGNDAELRQLVQQVNAVFLDVGSPFNLPVRIYREKHAMENGSASTLVIRLDKVDLPLETRLAWANALSARIPGVAPHVDPLGVRSPEASYDENQRAAGVVRGVTHME
jgi:hypothetical protein